MSQAEKVRGGGEEERGVSERAKAPKIYCKRGEIPPGDVVPSVPGYEILYLLQKIVTSRRCRRASRSDDVRSSSPIDAARRAHTPAPRARPVAFRGGMSERVSGAARVARGLLGVLVSGASRRGPFAGAETKALAELILSGGRARAAPPRRVTTAAAASGTAARRTRPTASMDHWIAKQNWQEEVAVAGESKKMI